MLLSVLSKPAFSTCERVSTLLSPVLVFIRDEYSGPKQLFHHCFPNAFKRRGKIIFLDIVPGIIPLDINFIIFNKCDSSAVFRQENIMYSCSVNLSKESSFPGFEVLSLKMAVSVLPDTIVPVNIVIIPFFPHTSFFTELFLGRKI